MNFDLKENIIFEVNQIVKKINRKTNQVKLNHILSRHWIPVPSKTKKIIKLDKTHLDLCKMHNLDFDVNTELVDKLFLQKELLRKKRNEKNTL